MRTLILLCLFSSCYCISGIGRKQTAGVVGRVVCNGKLAAGVIIKLYEKGKSKRELAQVKPDNRGSFKIPGTATELSKNDLQLDIHHRCNERMFYYKKSIRIPSKYITSGKILPQYFDVGTLELFNMRNKIQD